MEQYKLINAQLMDQVQSQRKIIGQMREEEVILKRKWMEEHERRIAEAQFNENKLKCAIKTLLQTLDMNLDLNVSSSNSRTSQASEYCRSSRSNSNRICSEFRRSSVLLQRSVPISPSNRSRSQNTRRSSDVERIECPSEVTNTPSDVESTLITTPEPRRLVELQEYISSPETDEIGDDQVHTTSPPPISSGLIFSIIEESDSEVTTSSSSIELEEPQTERVISDTKRASPLPLRDVTNISARPISSPKNTKAQGNSTFITQNDGENDIQETTMGHMKRAPQQRSAKSHAVSRISPKKKTVRGKSVIIPQNGIDCDNLEPSIEHVRHATRESSPIYLTVPSSSVNVGPDLTPRRSQLNFTSFNGIIHRPDDCSTPRYDEETLTTKRKAGLKRTKSTINSARESTEQSSNESLLSGRPSRSCRPKSLKEPNSRSKLRNETTAKL